MTPDDFKQKCDEIHTILCYLDDNENIPVGDIYNPVNVWFGHVDLRWDEFINCSILECAVRFIDKRNEIAKIDEHSTFSKDNWTLE